MCLGWERGQARGRDVDAVVGMRRGRIAAVGRCGRGAICAAADSARPDGRPAAPVARVAAARHAGDPARGAGQHRACGLDRVPPGPFRRRDRSVRRRAAAGLAGVRRPHGRAVRPARDRLRDGADLRRRGPSVRRRPRAAPDGSGRHRALPGGRRAGHRPDHSRPRPGRSTSGDPGLPSVAGPAAPSGGPDRALLRSCARRTGARHRRLAPPRQSARRHGPGRTGRTSGLAILRRSTWPPACSPPGPRSRSP